MGNRLQKRVLKIIHNKGPPPNNYTRKHMPFVLDIAYCLSSYNPEALFQAQKQFIVYTKTRNLKVIFRGYS